MNGKFKQTLEKLFGNVVYANAQSRKRFTCKGFYGKNGYSISKQCHESLKLTEWFIRVTLSSNIIS